MEIVEYLLPVSPQKFFAEPFHHPLALGNIIKCYKEEGSFPSLENIDIAIIGVNEDRNAPNNRGCAEAPDYVRKYLYNLLQGQFNVSVADIGNIRQGNTPEDTYFAVKSVVAQLMERKVLPIIIGGSQDLSYANYGAYESMGQIINIVAIDNTFDIGLNDSKISNRNYLNKILMHTPNFLFNYSNIGYQTYFVDQDAIDLMAKLYFDVYRLGAIRKNLEEVEPVVRNADMISIDIGAIRQSDAPGNANASPNGFYGEEICQIVRYAGLSDKLSSIGFYEINPSIDNGHQTPHLVAQMIWYFLDGFYHRKNDFPDRKRKDTASYIKYVVSIKDFQNEIIFYKSKLSDRWWMEVPCESFQSKYERQFLVPCSYRDYQDACKEELPEKWWRVYQKFLS